MPPPTPPCPASEASQFVSCPAVHALHKAARLRSTPPSTNASHKLYRTPNISPLEPPLPQP